jgi:hypothetical protein
VPTGGRVEDGAGTALDENRHEGRILACRKTSQASLTAGSTVAPE